MPTTLDEVYKEALSLPENDKAKLAELMVEYLGTHMDPGLERSHLDTVMRRKEEIRSGKVQPVIGQNATALARKMIKK